MMSFDPFSVRWFKSHARNIPRVLLATDHNKDEMNWLQNIAYKNLWLLRNVKPDLIGYDVELLPMEKISQLKEKGMPILGWTVQSAEKQKKVEPYLSNIIFEGYKP